mgnify:FL=1
MYQKQIVTITIDINMNKSRMMNTRNDFLFEQILTTFVNLRSLMYCPSKMFYQCLFFDTLPSSLISSILLELHVCVNTFTECLYLLDGRFKQLRLFDVQIHVIDYSTVTLDNKVTCYLEQFKEILIFYSF